MRIRKVVKHRLERVKAPLLYTMSGHDHIRCVDQVESQASLGLESDVRPKDWGFNSPVQCRLPARSSGVPFSRARMRCWGLPGRIGFKSEGCVSVPSGFRASSQAPDTTGKSTIRVAYGHSLETRAIGKGPNSVGQVLVRLGGDSSKHLVQVFDRTAIYRRPNVWMGRSTVFVNRK